MKIKRLVNIAMMTCFITICSWITIPSVVPFTMQTFAIFFTLLLLGGKEGLISILLYIFIGCLGLPVFSGMSGGIGHLISPTGGYIIGFVIIGICYCIFEKFINKNKIIMICVLLLGLLLCYITGTLWYLIIYDMKGTNYSFISILTICVLPYIIPDILKLILACFVSNQLRNILSKNK